MRHGSTVGVVTCAGAYCQVRGTMVLRPYGFAVWELLQADLDRRMKCNGVQNISLPSLIPASFIGREAQHVEGFAPELATVTHAGGKELSEPLVVRPTSETLVNWCLQRWVKSYRDLPLRLNQWCRCVATASHATGMGCLWYSLYPELSLSNISVVRWEKRPRLLLRNSEFLWHEGHTAHASADEAETEARRNIQMYAEVAGGPCALAVVQGLKSPGETFAGAVHSHTIETRTVRLTWPAMLTILTVAVGLFRVLLATGRETVERCSRVRAITLGRISRLPSSATLATHMASALPCTKPPLGCQAACELLCVSPLHPPYFSFKPSFIPHVRTVTVCCFLPGSARW